jgi:hypothetical protein
VVFFCSIFSFVCSVCPVVRFPLATVLSVHQFTAYDHPFGILLPLYCLSFSLRLLITPLVSCGHCIVCPSVYGLWLPLWYLVATVLSVLQFMAYDYPFGILWPLCCLSFSLRLMITPLVSSNFSYWQTLWYNTVSSKSRHVRTSISQTLSCLDPLVFEGFFLLPETLQ